MIAACRRLLLRPAASARCGPLCTSVRPLAAASSTAPRLIELPPTSQRRERIRRHGLIALSSEFVEQQHKQQQGKARPPDDSFRVQTYTVSLKRPAEFAVPAVYGYGRSRSKWLAAEVGAFGQYKLERMRESQRTHIRRELAAACIAYDDLPKAAGAALRKEVALNIQRLKDIRCYRGQRHERRLPSRGQRTKTNAKTRRRMGPLN